jgi:hypothetical protein
MTVMLRGYARLAFLGVAWLFVACLVVQVFLAGLGVFQDASAFVTHREFGYLFGLLTIVLVVLALVGRLPRAFGGWSALLLVLFALQSVFVVLRGSAPVVAALHPLNGFLILLIAISLARRARSHARWPVTEPAEPMTPESPPTAPAGG